MVCPDCQRPMIVPPPPERPVNRGPTEVDEEAAYAVRKETGQALSDDYAGYFPVKCPLCSTRLHATEDQIGRDMLCPDCNESFVVGPPPKPERTYDPRDEFDGNYDVAKPTRHDSPIPQRQWKGRLESHAEEAAESGHNETARGLRTDRLRWPLVTGVFSIPWYPGVRVRWLSLSAVGTLILAAVVKAISLLAGPGSGYMSIGPWIIGMLLSAVAFLFGTGWVGVTSINCLSILNDTAAGKDEVDSWPEGVFLDWVGDFFFVFNSLGIAMLPGIAVARLLVGFVGDSGWLAVPLGTVVMFPIFLLSMLEANSPMMPLSLPVWRSLLRVWWAWGLFYFETTLLGAALIGLVIEAVAIELTVWLAVPIASLLLVAAAMIYFRLLGRVAWCYARALVKDEQEAAESAGEEESEA